MFIGIYGFFKGSEISWFIYAFSIFTVSFGSAYYHWKPSNSTLFWDRLPMSIAFMGLYYIILEETLGVDSGFLLIALLILGISSVYIWKLNDDLRLYIIV